MSEKKLVPLPECPIKIPAWSQEGKETHITATKRCLITETKVETHLTPATSEEFHQAGTDPLTGRFSSRRAMDAGFRGAHGAPIMGPRPAGGIFKVVLPSIKQFTTDDCPIYEIEKCAIPEQDPGLEKAGVEVCAVVKVNEIEYTEKEPPEILNRITFRPRGCTVVRPDLSGFVVGRGHLMTPTGEHAPEGVVECVHTTAYVGPLEGIANVPDEQLAMQIGTEEALPKEIRFDPKMHFGALWSYVEGLVKEGIANIFVAATGPGEAPVGFNSEMQKQVYQAAAKVAPNWAQNNLLPAVLEAWMRGFASLKADPKRLHRTMKGTLEMLDESYGLLDVMAKSPEIKALVQQLFSPSLLEEYERQGPKESERDTITNLLQELASISLGEDQPDERGLYRITVAFPQWFGDQVSEYISQHEGEDDLWSLLQAAGLDDEFEKLAKNAGFSLEDFDHEGGDSTNRSDFYYRAPKFKKKGSEE